MGRPIRNVSPILPDYSEGIQIKTDDSDPRFISALARGLAILRCFELDQKLLGNVEIAEMTRLPKSTISRLTFTLTQLGYLRYRHEFGKYELAANDPTLKDKLELDLMFADAISKTLRLSNSSTLTVLGKIEKQYNLTPLLPSYAVDAPTGDTTGSSKPTKAVTALLEDCGFKISARAFNKIALADGWLEKLTRKSTTKEIKEFLSITEKGLRYGKNIISPTSPRETQPHWYVDSFKEFSYLVLKAE